MGGLLVVGARRLQESQSTLAPLAWAELQENSIFGNEQKPDLCLLAAVRLMLAGITTPRIECGDRLERNPSQQRGSQGCDCLLAQPPFGQKLERAIASLYRIPSSSGENLFLQHILSSLRPGGRAVVLVSEGLLFRGGAEEHLRKMMLNDYRVNAVVSLPAGAMMPYASIKPACWWFCSRTASRSIRCWLCRTTRRRAALRVPRGAGKCNRSPTFCGEWWKAAPSDRLRDVLPLAPVA